MSAASQSFPFLTFDDFRQSLPGKGRLLGLDPGSRRVGLAVSDSQWRVASPFRQLQRTPFGALLETLLFLAESERIRGLVVGWPLNMDASEGPRCQATKTLVANLKKGGLELPALAFDERWSTKAVERIHENTGGTTRGAAGPLDAAAAAFILQGALDLLRRVD